ncbi:hypothetical protein Bbelb_175880 [Branchiostoma belcheri]|nr:hypothetical protein Bbelb_175880 [Branchiostoma belcheri]
MIDDRNVLQLEMKKSEKCESCETCRIAVCQPQIDIVRADMRTRCAAEDGGASEENCARSQVSSRSKELDKGAELSSDETRGTTDREEFSRHGGIVKILSVTGPDAVRSVSDVCLLGVERVPGSTETPLERDDLITLRQRTPQ